MELKIKPNRKITDNLQPNEEQHKIPSIFIVPKKIYTMSNGKNLVQAKTSIVFDIHLILSVLCAEIQDITIQRRNSPPLYLFHVNFLGVFNTSHFIATRLNFFKIIFIIFFICQPDDRMCSRNTYTYIYG